MTPADIRWANWAVFVFCAVVLPSPDDAIRAILGA